MEMIKHEGGQTLWTGKDCEGNQVFGWSCDFKGVPCEPQSLSSCSEKQATEDRDQDLKNLFTREDAIAVLDENGDHMANAYVFRIPGGWAYVDDTDGWSPITKQDAENLVGQLV